MEPISAVVEDCKQKIKGTFQLPKCSMSSDFLGSNGDITMVFLHYLCMNEELMYEFLRRCGLLKASMTCELCDNGMSVRYERNQDRYVWRCTKRVKKIIKGRQMSVRCNGSKAVRFGSWFSQSKMTISEILWISYAIVNKTPLKIVSKEYGIGKHTLVDWANFCREVYIYHVEVNSKRIGGPGKIVEVDESKFGGKKLEIYNNGEGQWVLGGMEKGSGECFLIPIKDRNSDTLIRIVKDWVLPGTIIVSDSWEIYKCLEEDGYIKQSVSREECGSDCSGIEGTWRHIKESQPERSRDEEHFVGYLAAYMFHKHCQAENVDVFVKFLETVRAMYPC